MINTCQRSIYAGVHRLSQRQPITGHAPGVLGHRLVALCQHRDFNEIWPKPEARTSNIDKIGAAAGWQRVVRIFSDHGAVKLLGAGAVTIAALKFAQMNGVIIISLQTLPWLIPFWETTQAIPDISPLPLTFSGLALAAAKYHFNEGYDSVMSDDLEQASDADITHELHIRRACLRAQIRAALDAFGFGRENGLFRLTYKSNHHNLDTLNYGEKDREAFRRLNLDFEQPINRHDVLKSPDFLGINRDDPFEHYLGQ